MYKTFAGLAAGVTLVMGATQAEAASKPTDFGIRTVSGEVASEPPASASPAAVTRIRGKGIDLRSVASLGAQWGRVTSTYRSRARNRAVGGVRNSFHLSGRAIDIARRSGVTHAQIAAAYRNAGYHLIESLDEGDHSHFAFGTAPRYVPRARSTQQASSVAATQWRIVTAENAALK